MNPVRYGSSVIDFVNVYNLTSRTNLVSTSVSENTQSEWFASGVAALPKRQAELGVHFTF